MEDCELVMIISSIACAISKCCSEDEVSILSVVFTQLGDTLATLLTQKEIRERGAADKDTNNGEANNGETIKNTKCNQSDHNRNSDNKTTEINKKCESIYYKDIISDIINKKDNSQNDEI